MEKSNSNLTIQRIREQVCALPVSKNGKRQGLTDELKRSIVDTFKRSTLGVKEYSQQIHVSCSAFRKWKKDLSLGTQLKGEKGGF